MSARAGLYGVFALAIAMQMGLWLALRPVQARWAGVPPPPTQATASAMTLGDAQLAYRSLGLGLQNMGDDGGRTTALRDYDYGLLARWFAIADKLDPRADFVPLLAAFYFGGVEDAAKISPLADYLHQAGLRPGLTKWRWLAQAIYLARYKLNDTEKAARWAAELAALDTPGMPLWTRQMPAFIRNASGDKEAAYAIMVEILRSGKYSLPPQEIAVMQDYICRRILNPAQAARDPLCANLK